MRAALIALEVATFLVAAVVAFGLVRAHAEKRRGVLEARRELAERTLAFHLEQKAAREAYIAEQCADAAREIDYRLDDVVAEWKAQA